MAEGDIIIVDDQGTEHHFPPGFDPKQAAALVRNYTAPAAPLGTQPHSQTQDVGDGPTSDEPGYNGPETFWGGVGQSLKDQGRQLLGHLNPMLDTAAEPQDIGDMLNLVIPEVSGATAATAHTAAGPLEATGGALRSAGNSRVARKLEWALPGAIVTGNPKVAVAGVLPSMARGAGKILQRGGQALRKAEPEIQDIGAMPPVTEAPWRQTPDEVVRAAAESPMEGRDYQSQGRDYQAPVEHRQPMWPSDDLESTLNRMATEDKPGSVVNYTEPPVERPAPEGADMESAEGTADELRQSQPLGKPRVQSWKEGHGPSDDLIGRIRDEEGARAAASRLKISPDSVRERAPRTSPRSLPSDARARISSALAGMTPEERLTYLDSAGSGLTRNFIETEIAKLK